MKRWLGVLLALGLALGASAGRAQDQKPVRVLMVLLGGGPHDLTKTVPHLDKALASVGGFEVTKMGPSADKPQGDPAQLAKLADLKPGQYDALVFFTAGANGLTPEGFNAVKAFVDAGGGLVAIHSASGSFTPEWKNYLGGGFAGHAAGLFDLPITVTGTRGPMAGVSDFTIHDEEYTFNFAPDVQRRVVAQFKQRPANTVEKAGNNDVVWIRRQGQGRIFYSGLGHGEEAWTNPSWQKMTVQAILWAARQPREVNIAK